MPVAWTKLDLSARADRNIAAAGAFLYIFSSLSFSSRFISIFLVPPPLYPPPIHHNINDTNDRPPMNKFSFVFYLLFYFIFFFFFLFIYCPWICKQFWISFERGYIGKTALFVGQTQSHYCWPQLIVSIYSATQWTLKSRSEYDNIIGKSTFLFYYVGLTIMECKLWDLLCDDHGTVAPPCGVTSRIWWA